MKKEKIDIKYLGIPNICYSLTNKDDNRETEFIKQRIERGFDDSETWSLTDTIANFIIPRLDRYEEIAQDILKRDKKLINDIKKFRTALELIRRDNGVRLWTKEEEKEVEAGLKAFQKIFLTLWW